MVTLLNATRDVTGGIWRHVTESSRSRGLSPDNCGGALPLQLVLPNVAGYLGWLVGRQQVEGWAAEVRGHLDGLALAMWRMLDVLAAQKRLSARRP